MSQFTETTDYYVDPGATVDTGDGSIGSPWGPRTGGKCAVQHALDTITRDTTNGDQINVKAGTADTLNAALTLTSYGVPASSQPIILRGYTSAANDGGIGEVDGAATYVIMDAGTSDATHFIDMKMGNCGSAQILNLDNWSQVINCELYGSSNAIAILTSSYCSFINCYIHTITSATTVISVVSGGNFHRNYVEGGATTDRIFYSSTSSMYSENVLVVNSTDGVGIMLSSYGAMVQGNVIYSTVASTKGGIEGFNTNAYGHCVINNIIEGFSGTGGAPVKWAAGTRPQSVMGGNVFYNNDTDAMVGGEGFLTYLGNDVIATASPFTAAGSGDFTPTSEAQAVNAFPIVNGLPTKTSYKDSGAYQVENAGGGGSGGVRGTTMQIIS